MKAGPPEKLSIREKFGYGLGDTASNFYWKFFEFYLVYFYTDVFGITSAAVGTMMLVTRIWDAVNDPLVGYLADRTKTAWGRFRPYLVWMALPFAITGILTFYTPDLSANGKLIYAYITYTLVMMAYTAINIPYGALMGVISSSSSERTSVSTYRFVLAFVGGVIVQYFTLSMVRFFSGVETLVVDGEEREVLLNERAGFFWTMVVYSIAAVILFLIAFISTRERVSPPPTQKSNFLADTKDLCTNRPWMVLFVFGLFQLMAAFIRGSVIIYYFKYYVGDASYSAAFLVLGSLAAILGMFPARYLSSLFGKKAMMIGMNVGTATLTAAFLLVGPEQIWLMFLLYILASLISGPSPVLLWAMYADVADFSEWKNKRRATGLIFSAATFSQKLGCAIGAAGAGWTLAFFEYQNPIDGVDQIQSEQTLFGIKLMMSVLPAAFLILAATSLLFYNLSQQKMEQIEADLATAAENNQGDRSQSQP